MLQFLALFFVIGIAIHLIRERANEDEAISLSDATEEARNFRAKAAKVDSAYFADRGTGLQQSAGSKVVTEVQRQKINLNSATLEDLMTLPKIGKVTAGRIIEYRTAHGGFKSVEELMHVKGIGEKTLERIKHEVSIE